MKQKLILLLAVGLVIAVVYKLSGSWIEQRESKVSDKPQITASFYPLYFFTKEIAGNEAGVYNLTPAGAEPHDFEPTAKDMARMEESDIVIVNGGIEPWFDKIKDNLAGKQVAVLAASDGLLSQDFADEDGKKVKDPHIWLSPPLARQMAERIATAIIKIDPAHEPTYRARTEALTARLMELDAKFRSGLASCKQKTFVTSHTAFGYLAGEYGLTQIGIAGISTEDEPTARELAEVSKFTRANNIKYIFFETLTSPKLAETIARETRAATLVLNPLEGLSDAEMTAGENYVTVMEKNLVHLRTALQCQ